jgi:hypothetical protein
MPRFVNATAFDNPKSRLQAMGGNLSPDRAIVDPKGNVLAYAQTGGMIGPERCELHPPQMLYRFGRSGTPPQAIANGGWWMQKREFELLVRFANTHSIYVGLAMRLLCLVPPEWSDAGMLIRARVSRSLLAWRGLGNSVVVPPKTGNGLVRMPHQNEISARRVHQLFIPGVAEANGLEPAISVEQSFTLDPNQSNQGFLYL